MKHLKWYLWLWLIIWIGFIATWITGEVTYDYTIAFIGGIGFFMWLFFLAIIFGSFLMIGATTTPMCYVPPDSTETKQ